MKFIHISDLHLGKRVYEYSMIEDQRHLLMQVKSAIESKGADCLLISGDVYDKSVPSVEAVELFDEFLNEVSKTGIKVFIISGNHDSGERLSFGSDILRAGNIFISKPYDGNVMFHEISDMWGKIRIYMIPFVKPAHVKKYHDPEKITDYNSALRQIAESMNVDRGIRNIVLVHQFITGAVTSNSEEHFLGGMDNVDFDIFDDFDYVALGHIHKPQSMGRREVRYSGSMLKYSVDEIEQNKSMTYVELKDKGEIIIDTISYKPLRDMVKLKGTYMELADREFYKEIDRNNYFYIVLTDEEEVPDGLRKLRVIYPNIIKLDYFNRRTKENGNILEKYKVKQKSMKEYLEELFLLQNNGNMSEKQSEVITEILEELE